MGIGRRPQRRRIGRAAVAGPAACAAVALVAAQPLVRLQPQPPRRGQPARDADAERQARAVCGSCHAFPPPDILPRGTWRDEFVRMMFIREEPTPPLGPPGVVNRSVQLPPDMEQVLPFYTSHAPERLPLPEPWPEPGESPLSFTRHALDDPRNARHAGGVARAPRRLSTATSSSTSSAPTCARGSSSAASGRAGGTLTRSRAFRTRPTSRSTDVDKDGVQDLLVADLGQFFPGRSQQGRRDLAARPRRRASTARSGSTAGRASPASTRRTSTATARPISRSPRSAGARPGRSPSSRTARRTRRSRRSSPTRSIRAPAASTSFPSI